MNYAALAKLAGKLIADSGKPIILVRPWNGTFDAGLGSTSGSGAPSTFDGAAVEIAFENPPADDGIVGGSKKRLLASGIPLPVVASDTLIMESRTWTILKVTPLSPGSVVLLYELEVG